MMRVGNKAHRSYRKFCTRCDFNDDVLINTMKSHAGDDHHLEKILKRKFEEKVWEVGKRDVCPICVNKMNRAKKREEKTVVPAKPEAKPEANNVVAMTAPEPRKLTPEYRGIIYAKLQDVYDPKRPGYLPGWTDEKVATDMNAPRAWVTETRELLCGTVGSNPEIDAALEEGRAMALELDGQIKSLQGYIVKLQEHRGKVDISIANVEKLRASYTDELASLEKKLDSIAKAVRAQ
jgi:hypothetical protein